MASKGSDNLNAHIPVIDISHEDDQTAENLVRAVVAHGFVFVKGSRIGFTPDILNEAFKLVRLYIYSHVPMYKH